MQYEYAVIDEISKRLAGPLPGREAQYRMATLRRIEDINRLGGVPDHAKVACVLHLLHWEHGAWRTLLIQRTANPRDRHAGQISFPGGRHEEHDGTLQQVALRETEEEVGIPASSIRVIGRLTDLYIPVSNYLVHPFVGVLETPARFIAQPGEVDEIIRPPMRMFYDEDNRKRTDVPVAEGILLKDVPHFAVENRIVWGATAMILNEFIALFPEGLD
jgi:8-oxo-dGTP pyrophosphatase MutT (NUDIX family)